MLWCSTVHLSWYFSLLEYREGTFQFPVIICLRRKETILGNISRGTRAFFFFSVFLFILFSVWKIVLRNLSTQNQTQNAFSGLSRSQILLTSLWQCFLWLYFVCISNSSVDTIKMTAWQTILASLLFVLQTSRNAHYIRQRGHVFCCFLFWLISAKWLSA